jgi:hypothetical protein
MGEKRINQGQTLEASNRLKHLKHEQVFTKYIIDNLMLQGPAFRLLSWGRRLGF